MRQKDGVRAIGVQAVTVYGMALAESTIKRITAMEMVVTSVTEGRHGLGSLHYKGLAFDIRISAWTPMMVENVTNGIKKDLGPDWDVVLETDHIHVEHDPKTPLSTEV